MKRPFADVPFSRANVYARDEHRCQYCGRRFPPSQLTFDHVIPVARGGHKGWDNIVTCCIPCNRTKGDRTPEEVGLPPRAQAAPSRGPALPDPEPGPPPRARELARLPLLGPLLGPRLTPAVGPPAMSLSRQPPDDGPARDPAVDLHRAGRRARSTSSGAPSRSGSSSRTGVIYTSWSNDPRESLGQFLIRDAARHRGAALQGPARARSRRARCSARSWWPTASSPRRTCASACRPRRRRRSTTSSCGRRASSSSRTARSPTTSSSTSTCGVTAVILEGVRRVDEWRRIREVFPSMDITFTLPRTPPAASRDPAERQALALAARGQDPGRDQPGAAPLASSNGRLAASTSTAAGCSRWTGCRRTRAAPTRWAAIQDLLAAADQRLAGAALRRGARGLRGGAGPRPPQPERQEGPDRRDRGARAASARCSTVPLDKVPVLRWTWPTLTRQNFDPQEGFVLSRVNGEWDVQLHPEALPDGGRGRAADLRPPPRAQGHRAARRASIDAVAREARARRAVTCSALRGRAGR